MSKDALQASYDARVAKGELNADAAQQPVIAALDTILAQFRSTRGSVGILGKLFGRKPEPIRGLYIWGQVGRGKSMLMDSFYAHAPEGIKRREHFHAFMQDVHGELHGFRQQKIDPVPALIKKLSNSMRLLCLDELQAPDITDASLLYRLFAGLAQEGVTIVCTSNRPPEELYQGGVQAERFEAFTQHIHAHFNVLCLDSPTDYRQQQRHSLRQVYFHPLDKHAKNGIQEALAHLCPGVTPTQDMLVVQKRALEFTSYPPSTGVFSFAELCGKALGAADYLALAERLDALVLTDIPTLTPEQRNEAKRFVTLIDALYEHKVLLVCSADAAPEALYPKGSGSFEFARTASRLKEMQSEHYVHTTR